MIVVVNKSESCTDNQVQAMVRGCETQIRQHVAPTWGLFPPPVVYLSSEKEAPIGAWVIAVLEDADQAGELGWHTEDQGDLIYGRVFARPILENNGGILLDDHLSVSSILSHEVIETVIDPHINLWANKGNGVAYALEACDPVESDVYSIQVPHLGQVTVSNFVTPRWFSPQAINDKFDWMGKTGNAFEVTKGGYVVYSDHGTVHAQAGADHPKWRKDTKRADTARSARRFPAP